MISSRCLVVLAVVLGACGGPVLEDAPPDEDSASIQPTTPRATRANDAGADGDTKVDAAPAPTPAAAEELPSPPFGKPVRFVYLVPSDKTQKPDYVKKITRAAAHLQTFYRSQLSGSTFSVHSTIVEVHTTPHPASWYSTHVKSGVSMLERWWTNAVDDGFALTGAKFDDPDYVWLFYVDSDNACGQHGGAGTSHVGAFPSNDLRGLAGEPKIPTCAADPPDWYDTPPCRWVGGMAHELGHALGLPHPPGCEENKATCDAHSVMWTGVYEYPTTYFNAAERASLGASSFIKSGAAAPNFDCNKL